MNTHLLLASALRTLIMGVSLFAALRLLRIHQVQAQRTAWLLALVSALAMPAFVGGHLGLPVLPQMAKPLALANRHSGRFDGNITRAGQSAPQSPADKALTAESTATHDSTTPVTHVQARRTDGDADPPLVQVGPSLLDHTSFDARSLDRKPAAARTGDAQNHPSHSWPLSFSATLYVLVAGFLLMRLLIGLTIALRLRSRGQVAGFHEHDGTEIRISNRLLTPVTIANTILLPVSSSTWSEQKLRVVLSHERAHVEQKDFYIQLVASLNCAIFWFNPFSWWLQKHLSSLGEAMSDLAGVEQAESRASYAEVLLEFASGGQWPLTSVAMARSTGLRIRIERLLSEQLFVQSYTGRRRLPFLAATLCVVAVCSSTATVRVHAAQTAAAPAVAVTAQPLPERIAETATPVPAPFHPVTVAAPSVSAPSTPHGASTAYGTNHAISIAAGPSSAFAGKAIAPDVSMQIAQQDVPTPPTAPTAPAAPATPEAPAAPAAPSPGSHSSYTYTYNDNGEIYAIVSGDDTYTFNGDWNQKDIFDAARRNLHGNFIYYRHDGKSYVIQDPAIVARGKALYAPMQALGKEQEAFGKQQAALGRQQEEIGRNQSEVKITNPDFSKERKAMEEALEELKSLQAQKEVDRQSLAALMAKIGSIEGRLGAMQAETSAEQSKIGAEQGAIGAMQSRLGEQQRELGAQQSKLGQEAHRQMLSIIQQAIKDGAAKPID